MSTDGKIHILGISGSIRRHSFTANLLTAVARLLPEEVKFEMSVSVATMPHFNPDEEAGNVAVLEFRQQLKETDGIIISTPEYAFGIPGVLKNALDWVVSSGELNDKPVVAISASPLATGGDKAMASLLLTLTALGTKMEAGSSLKIPAIKKKINVEGEIIDHQTITDLKLLMDELLNSINAIRKSGR